MWHGGQFYNDDMYMMGGGRSKHRELHKPGVIGSGGQRGVPGRVCISADSS